MWHAECRRCREGRCSEAKVVVGRAVGISAYVTGMEAWSSGVKATEGGDDGGGGAEGSPSYKLAEVNRP